MWGAGEGGWGVVQGSTALLCARGIQYITCCFPAPPPPSVRLGDDAEILPQQLLRKYITYAKQHCRPQLQQADYDRITKVYTELRAEASRTHGMPVAVRHLESIIRMSEAHAKMHLRDFVTDGDINVAIK